MDVFAIALQDHFYKNLADTLWLHNSYGDPEEMPVDVFFRSEDEMSDMEILALSLCNGKILDAGAGVGSHALLLQGGQKDVSALEISGTACSIMEERNVKNIIHDDFLRYCEKDYDTILMLMNGIGLAGNLKQLPFLMRHCKKLLRKNGQIIFDSSDISYLYEGHSPPKDRYFGEVRYQYQYKKLKGEWFEWLYIDQQTISDIAAAENLNFEVLAEDDSDQYLGRLTAKNTCVFL